jgi:hypothetical protein
MAVDPKDVTVTRDHVHAWLAEFDNGPQTTNLRDFLADKLGDVTVNTRGMDEWGDETPLIDILMADINTYCDAE